MVREFNPEYINRDSRRWRLWEDNLSNKEAQEAKRDLRERGFSSLILADKIRNSQNINKYAIYYLVNKNKKISQNKLYLKQRGNAKKYLIAMLMEENGLSMSAASKEAEKRLKLAEKTRIK